MFASLEEGYWVHTTELVLVCSFCNVLFGFNETDVVDIHISYVDMMLNFHYVFHIE